MFEGRLGKLIVGYKLIILDREEYIVIDQTAKLMFLITQKVWSCFFPKLIFVISRVQNCVKREPNSRHESGEKAKINQRVYIIHGFIFKVLRIYMCTVY